MVRANRHRCVDDAWVCERGRCGKRLSSSRAGPVTAGPVSLNDGVNRRPNGAHPEDDGPEDDDHRHHRPGRLVPRRVSAGKGYEVHGIKRRASSFNTQRIDHLYQDPHESKARFYLHYGDLTDVSNLTRIIAEVAAGRGLQPRRAEPRGVSASSSRNTPRTSTRSARCACSRRSASWACRTKTRFYQASTSEMYGLVQEMPQTETHAVLPALAVRRGQALRLLDHGELPRGLRHVRLQRHPVQPRVAAARRDLRHPQDHPRPGTIKLGLQDCCSSATWTRSATGAMPGTTSRCSG